MQSVACSVMTYAHAHEDYDHALWFSAYLPKDGVGEYYLGGIYSVSYTSILISVCNIYYVLLAQIRILIC